MAIDINGSGYSVDSFVGGGDVDYFGAQQSYSGDVDYGGDYDGGVYYDAGGYGNEIQYETGDQGVREGGYEAPYVGQGYDGNLEGMAANDFASFSQQRQERAEMPQQQQQVAQQQGTQQQQVGRPEQPRQQGQRQAAMQAAAPRQAQQAPAPAPRQEASAPTQQQPTGQIEPETLGNLSAQSARERETDIADAFNAGDTLATAGVRGALSRAVRTNSSEEAASSQERQSPRLPRNAAERAAMRRIARANEETESNDDRRPFWANPIERVRRFSQNFQLRPANRAITKARQKQAATSFKREGVGNHIYGKILGLSSLEFDEVGVGLSEIMDVVRQNPETLENLLSRYMQDMPSIGMMSVSEIVSLINNNDIWVATFKPPDNQGPDMQRRKLRVLTQQQRGIYLHNIMAAMYTADYDGDDMGISLDPDVSPLVKNPMDHMVDIFGNITLNEDFLPVTRILPTEDMTAEEYVKTVMLADFSDVDGRSMRALVDSIIKLGESELDTEKQSESWGKFFVEARKFADRMTRPNERGRDAFEQSRQASNDMMSRICKAVFDSMQRTKYYNSLSIVGGDVLLMDDDKVPKPVTYGDVVAYRIMDDMVEGSLPNNFQELKLLLTGFTGNVEKKNAPFRFTADVGKMMKMDERLRVGNEYVVDPNNDEHMKLFFESTVKFAGSIKMAREIKKAGRSSYYTQVLRESVIREVGFPDDPGRYRNFGEFLDAFTRSYNRNSAIINEANITFLTNMGIASNSNKGLVSPLRVSEGGITYGDIAEPILTIYGTYSVGRMFKTLTSSGYMNRSKQDDFWAGNPNARKREHTVEQEHGNRRNMANFWITGKYIDFSLRQFRDENRLIRKDSKLDDRKDARGNVSEVGVRNTKISTPMSDVDAQFNLMLAIADKRTGAASKYNLSTFGDMKRGHKADETTTVNMMSKLLKQISESLQNDSDFDQPIDIDNAVSALIMADPDLFMHYNMDSSASFLQSEWGKKMLEHANDLEVLGSIYTSMMFDYRMERITALSEEFLANDDITMLEQTWNDLMFAKDELASSSGVWHGIIREFEAESTPGMQSFFKMMTSHKTPMQTAPDQRSYEWDIEKDARDFWDNPGNHTTLRSVIDDLDMDRNTKWNVIADVVRYWEKDAYLKSYEVGYQLGLGKSAAYGNSSMKGVLTVHREFEQAFNRWGNVSRENLKKDVQEAYEEFSDRPGLLTNVIKRLDEEPWELVSIDSLMYADSILSVYDKTYAQTEKASQNPWTNSIYSALSLQQTGGFSNDVHRTDDRLLGLTSVNDVSIQDIIHLLANPEAEMTVYGHDGRWGLLTRDILLKNELGELSGNIEADMWQFLLRSPRIASAIRRHSTCVTTDSKGGGFLGASNSIAETMERLDGNGADVLEHTKYIMRDHPGYAGIISLALPGSGLVTRNARYRVREIENFLAYELYGAAISDWKAKDIAEIVLNDLGITDKGLRLAMRSGYDSFLERLGLEAYKYADKNDRLESDVDADEIYGYAIECITKYIEELRNSENGVRLGQYVPKPPEPNFSNKITSFRGKNSFLSNFYETSVAINGLTYRNAEAAFQAQKCANPNDRVKFVNLTGAQARKLGRNVVLRSDWEAIKESVMRKVISSKFSDPNMRQMLVGTGDAELVEGNTWGDQTWGVSNGSGQNLLGKILMEERGIPASENKGIGPDAVSAAAFWDTIQELSGAKTSVSTGIEGWETYQFAEWASHIKAKDAYADLQAITEDPRFGGPEWDMAWTNVPAPDGGQMSLHVEGQTIANLEEIEDAAREQGIGEIIVQVPDGYIVRDRSTDTKGTQVASLFAYFVSKRANGAEAFNLKAKKAGIDRSDPRSDSITKKLDGGKHKVDGSGRTVSYIETMLRLRDVARRSGIQMAQQELAKMMLAENEEIGYKDLSLANYMSIAQLMLLEGEDGEIYLRSLEMLMSAIKYRIGWQIDDMSDEQLTQAVMDIVTDASETGVGIARMESLEALDNFRPSSKSMQHDAIRQSSSVFKRNYSLLTEITEKAKKNGVEPMAPDDANRINGRLSGMIRKANKPSGKILGRLRGYNVVGVLGCMGVNNEINLTIGPSNVIYVGSSSVSKKELVDACRDAYRYGMTIVCEAANIDNLPPFLQKTAVPISDDSNDVLIPCFDARLNGSEAKPVKGQFAIAQVPFSKYVVSVEDSLNEFGLGDAEGKATTNLTGRMSMRDGDSVRITAESLFPNVFKNPNFKGCRFKVGLANGEEIKSQIADGVTCTIDYGITEGSAGFEQRQHDVDKAIERYQQRWTQANPDGLMMGKEAMCEPGDIVGWAEVEITNPDGSLVGYVLAPIIPFPLHGPRRQPVTYSVENMGPLNNDGTLFHVDWENRTELTDNFVKYFDSSGGANKGMISFADALDESRTLLDGTAVDVYIAKASTDSRKVGTDRRIKTMISLMALARMHGYNFARKPDGTVNENAFPDNPDVRERLFRDRISKDEWRALLDQNIKFVIDPTLNAFIRYECDKIMDNGGNPSDYLANLYTDENGVESNTHVMWEFEAMFDQGLNYEDGLLRFLRFVNPKNTPDGPDFCPNGIEDATNDTLFRLYQQGNAVAQGYDRGVLQMRVPHKHEDGGMAYVWDNVYIGMSFFGEEYSGFFRPNVNGASNFLDGMNTMSMYGVRLDPESARHRADWATSDIARLPHDNGSYEKAVR